MLSLVAAFCFRGAYIVLFIASVLHPQQRGYFYTGKTYGSQGNFNPVTHILNSAYDDFQVLDNRSLLNQYYAIGTRNVLKNLGRPFHNIKAYGTRQFITNEIIPTSFNKEHGQWWPNYTLHLMGGGMAYRQMLEWYRFNNAPAPAVLAVTTVAATWLVNEAIENDNHTGINVDAIADIMLFDVGGVVLFSFDNVSRFFAETLNMADWSLQPSVNFQNGTLHNNGQYYQMKWEIPWLKQWYVSKIWGYADIVGAAYKFESGEAISAGYGLDASRLITLDARRNKKTADLVNCAGVYYDRNNSLLASLVYSARTNNRLVLNVFPGLFTIANFSPGCWLSVNKNGSMLGGITLRGMPGVAVQ